MPSEEYVAVVYQRPVEDPFSGGSTHLRGFLSEFSKYQRVLVVAPAPMTTDWTNEAGTILGSARTIIRANFRALRFVLCEAFMPPSQRSKGTILFDIYASALPLVWARITGRPVVYFAQDIGAGVTRLLRRAGYRGSFLLSAFRLPLERLLLEHADLLVTVSDEMTRALQPLVRSPSRICTCPLNRPFPGTDLSAIRYWQRRLDLENRTGIVFVGNLNYPPNRAATEFIVGRLLPKARDLGNRVVFILVGKGTEEYHFDGPPELVGLGPVEDLSSLLYACHVGIAPMEVSGGVSGKAVDYLLHGIRLVVTPEVAASIGEFESVHVASLSDFPRVLNEVVRSQGISCPGVANTLPASIRERYLSGAGVRDLAERVARLIQ